MSAEINSLWMNRWFRVWVVLSCLVLAPAVGYYLAANKSDTIHNMSSFKDKASTTNQKSFPSKHDPLEQPVDHVKDQVASTLVVKQRTAADIAIVNSWFARTGFDPEPQQLYDQQYTDEQLRALADTGDIIAIEALILRHVHKGSDEWHDLAEMGAIYGSYDALSALAGRWLRIPHSYDSPEMRQEKIHALKEQFARLGILELRGVGKLFPVDIDKRNALNRIKEAYGEEEPLSEEDYRWINQRTLELYNHYQSERRKLNLGDFDNELPKEVQEFVDL